MSSWNEERWDTAFAKFVRKFGAEKLAEKLGVTRSAIYHWIRGSFLPHAENAMRIVTIAKEAGFELTLEDVYRHKQAAAKAELELRCKQAAAEGAR